MVRAHSPSSSWSDLSWSELMIGFHPVPANLLLQQAQQVCRERRELPLHLWQPVERRAALLGEPTAHLLSDHRVELEEPDGRIYLRGVSAACRRPSFTLCSHSSGVARALTEGDRPSSRHWRGGERGGCEHIRAYSVRRVGERRGPLSGSSFGHWACRPPPGACRCWRWPS